jgi:hypothetical protein
MPPALVYVPRSMVEAAVQQGDGYPEGDDSDSDDDEASQQAMQQVGEAVEAALRDLLKAIQARAAIK